MRIDDDEGGEGSAWDTLGYAVFICVVLAGCAWLTGCSSTEHIRLDKDAAATAQEAGCPPLPVCDIPPAANSTQLESALWACVLEYRALYSVCYHLVHPVQPPDMEAIPAEVF